MADPKLTDPVQKWITAALQNPTRKEKGVVRSMARSLASDMKTKLEVQKAKWAGIPLLHFAAEHGYQFMFQLLLEEFHVDINLSDPDKGTTAFHYLAATGQRKLLESLLKEHTGDIDAADQMKSTPLCFAITYNKISTMNMLLVYNAKTDIMSFLGMPIHLATLNNNMTAVELLLTKSPEDVNAECFEYYNPLALAALYNSTDCFMYLAQCADVNINMKPLCYKIICNSDSQERSLECINALMTFGMDPNLFYQGMLQEELPIICAAKKGWNTVVSALLGPTENILGIDNWTVQGLLDYVNNDNFKEMNRLEREARVAQLKETLMSHLDNGSMLTADLICKSLRPDMQDGNGIDYTACVQS